MELGMIGLGRMGANMSVRLMQAGHRVVANARTRQSVDRMVEQGADGAYSLAELAASLAPPRIAWVMVPAPTVDAVLEDLLRHLQPGDLIVDGGNSYYKETMRRAETIQEAGLDFVDVGTSGGIWGLAEGYCLMAGGSQAAVARLQPLLEVLAPAPDRGWAHVGPSGAGHFVKMVHNGIEYGMMQAFAEGFAIMQAKDELDLDLSQISELWRHGSVVRSWLLDLIARALADDTELAQIAPYVADSGEGRWTVAEAIELDRAAPVITMALLQRLRSRDELSYSDRLLAVMRNQFGGHEMKKDE